MVKVPIWAYYCMNSYVTTRARSTRVLQYCHFDNIVLLTSGRLDGDYVPRLDKRRIYDRILEMCTPMYVGGTSKREVIASMKMEKAKTLLNTNRGEEDCE